MSMHEEEAENKKRLIISILLNSAITISEAITGILTGSLALLSDASHNLSDVLSLILGYFGETFSKKGPTEKHTFGYKRFEVITSFINASFLLIVGTYILFEAYNRFQNPSPIDPFWVILVASIALFGNVGSIFILNRNKKSLNIRAVILHLALDSLASVGVVISGILIFLYDLFIADVIISLLISVFIYYSAFDVMKEVFDIIMESTPLEIEFNEVKEYLEEFDEIESIHDLHIWSLSSTEKIISCHICIASNTKEDELIKKIEDGLVKKFGFDHVTIQIEESKVCETGNHSPSDIV